MQIGIDSFAAWLPDAQTGERIPAHQRMSNLLEEIEIADHAGIDIFGLGEHQRTEFLDSATSIVLAAAAARTTRIRLTSSVTVLGAADPVRVYQDYAAIDLISRGRAEIIVGRGAFREAFALFGVDDSNHDEIFAEKLGLLLALRENNHIHWSGKSRAPLTGQGVFPRAFQRRMPVWIGVGGTPQSFARAGAMGLPLMLAIIGGNYRSFRPLLDLYRKTGRQAGQSPDALKVGIHIKGFVADSDVAARDAFFPGWHHILKTIGAERGWPAPQRPQFDAMCDRDGPFLIGNPDTVARKMHAVSADLGGLDRITFEMSSASLDVAAMKRSITLLGEQVRPLFDAITNDMVNSGRVVHA